jgi:hypothetical protein
MEAIRTLTKVEDGEMFRYVLYCAKPAMRGNACIYYAALIVGRNPTCITSRYPLCSIVFSNMRLDKCDISVTPRHWIKSPKFTVT